MIISLAAAKEHLRVGGTESDGILAFYIGAAEQSAAEYLNRKLYSDSAELAAAIAAVPSVLAVASAAYEASLAAIPASITTTENTYAAAITAAGLIVNSVNRAAAVAAADAALIVDKIEIETAAVTAQMNYTAAQTIARETRAGMVITDMVTAAILMTLTDLFESRGNTVIGTIVASLPFGSRSLLQPYRREIGI